MVAAIDGMEDADPASYALAMDRLANAMVGLRCRKGGEYEAAQAIMKPSREDRHYQRRHRWDMAVPGRCRNPDRCDAVKKPTWVAVSADADRRRGCSRSP